MKKIIILLLVFLVSFSVHAQLANTTWKGVLNIEGGMEAFFNFGNDTLEVFNASNKESMETMKYMVKDSLLTLQKIFGGSECDNSTPGNYKFEIKNDERTLSLLSDSCYIRSEAIGTIKLNKE